MEDLKEKQEYKQAFDMFIDETNNKSHLVTEASVYTYTTDDDKVSDKKYAFTVVFGPYDKEILIDHKEVLKEVFTEAYRTYIDDPHEVFIKLPNVLLNGDIRYYIHGSVPGGLLAVDDTNAIIFAIKNSPK